MKRNILLALITLSIFLFALVGCGSGINEADARMVATNAALGTPPPPQYQTAAAVYLYFTLTPIPQPQTNSIDLAATMIYDNMASGLTQQAVQQQIVQQQSAMTATAVAVQATASYQAEMAALATQGAREQATQQAWNQYATSTQQAFFIQGTATQQERWVQGTATERSWQMTVTTESTLAALQISSMKTAQAAEAVRLAGESRQIELAVERQEIKNRADAILPWALVISALIVAGALAFMAGQFREVRRNPDGTYNLPSFRTKQGWTVLRPELMPLPAVSLGRNGSVNFSAPNDPADQAEVTRRAQGVAALRALPPGREKQALQIANQAFGAPGTPMPAVEILPPSPTDIGAVLDELEGQVLDYD